MNASSSGRLLAKLQELSTAAGANYFERISIANQLMQDREWLEREFKGEDYKAATVLEVKYFHDLSGSMTIWMLLQIYRKFPIEKQWQDLKYNLRALYEKCKPETEHRTQTRVKVANYQMVVQENKEVKFHNKQLEKKVEEKESELDRAQKRIVQLEGEVLRLKGRIESLERIVQGKLAS